ncbi:hypothetical protein THRCLA_21201 [Thraustotheca clavata]|uniref:Uncharacterized protein n=1 Tax=Thraustotheca clavata TaxID=74557 RepID=A0A1V9ZZ05_9STRA|nr:hypothetical protein THRCLA_21201 [Thraustotheca clavata]
MSSPTPYKRLKLTNEQEYEEINNQMEEINNQSEEILTEASLAVHDFQFGTYLDDSSDDDLVSISSMSTIEDEKESKESHVMEEEPQEKNVENTTPKPVLRGPYEVWYNEVKWSGSWGFSPNAFDQPGQMLSKFYYKCIECTDPTMELNRPKSGVYEGYFLLQPFHGKPKRIVEKQVTISFKQLSPTTYQVEGSGKNKFGKFTLHGMYEWGNPLQMEKIYVS